MNGPSATSPRTLLLVSDNGRESVISRFGCYFLGRDRACDICFPEDSALSGRHALIFHDGRDFRIIDYRSANGTSVDKQPVLSAVLESGSLISVGTRNIRVYLDTEPTCTAPRLFEQTDMDPVTRKLVFLNRAAASLFLADSEETLCINCVRSAASVFAAKRVFLAGSSRGRFFRLLSNTGWNEAPNPQDKCFISILRHCYEEGLPIISSQAEEAGQTDSTYHFDAYIAFPIRSEGEFIGIMFLCRTKEKQPFTREETSQIVPFARYAALAFRSARLSGQEKPGTPPKERIRG